MEPVDSIGIQILIENGDNTTAQEARRGKDIQGITWERTIYQRRDLFRQNRLRRLERAEREPSMVEQAKQECQPTVKEGTFYDFFQYNKCLMPSVQDHINWDYAGKMWSTSKHDIYFSSQYKIGHFNAMNSRTSEILDLSGHVAPSQVRPGSHMEGFTDTVIAAMTVGHNLLIVGGHEGQLICKQLDRPGISFCFKPTSDGRKINCIEVFRPPTPTSQAMHFMASDDQGSVKFFDVETFQFSHFQFPWPVKHASSSPDGRQLVVVGKDDPEGRLVDSETGLTIQSFRGHYGYSCSSAWHPDGIRFATGNKDTTCRIWDVRNLSRSVCALQGNATSISSICFTSDGRFMAIGERVDFVHVYDVNTEFNREQEIDFFGCVSGLSFSPDTEALFIGVSENTFPTLFWYNRRRNYYYLDSM